MLAGVVLVPHAQLLFANEGLWDNVGVLWISLLGSPDKPGHDDGSSGNNKKAKTGRETTTRVNSWDGAGKPQGDWENEVELLPEGDKLEDLKTNGKSPTKSEPEEGA